MERICKSSAVVVLGMYYKDKEGLFFEGEGKKNRDLWPYIKHYCDTETSIICLDQAKQYYGVEKFFKHAVHKSTNHSMGEFVSKPIRITSVSDLENENKQLKAILKKMTTKRFIISIYKGVFL